MIKYLDVYKNTEVFSKMMEKIQETKDQYYVDASGAVLIKSGHSKVVDYNYHGQESFRQTSGWTPYLEIMEVDKRLQDEVIINAVGGSL